MFRKQGESTFQEKGKCPRAQPLSEFRKIPDSVQLYTQNLYNTSFAADANKAHQLYQVFELLPEASTGRAFDECDDAFGIINKSPVIKYYLFWPWTRHTLIWEVGSRWSR